MPSDTLHLQIPDSILCPNQNSRNGGVLSELMDKRLQKFHISCLEISVSHSKRNTVDLGEGINEEGVELGEQIYTVPQLKEGSETSSR